ncbi:tyrosine-protein phosphatase [Flavobacterium sp.]|uniref:tyrosine-protein phosphatase n=1 Tax=Flavobacterium sp. TaxID=239 RepID=UPI0037C0A7B6
MIFFSSKKPYLKDLVPSNYADIHSHLLAGIDDGAKTVDESVQLIHSLQSFGFEQFITTPHIMEHLWNNTKETIYDSLQQLQNELAIANHLVSIQAAAEYFMDGHFSELAKQQSLLCLKDNYVLVEMSYLNPPLQLMDLIFDCQVAGYRLVLAHPERYLFYHSNFDKYRKLKKAGCFFQLNLLSVTGYYGQSVAVAAEQLLKQGMIDFVGSDVHHQNHVKAFENRVLQKDLQPLKVAFDNNRLFRNS